MTGSSTAVLDAPATTPPGVGWASGPLGEVQAADRELARQTARRYRAIAVFAATRPASADRAQGEHGAMAAERWAARPEVLRPVSEWTTQELSIALNVSAQRAEDELERSLTLTRRLPLALDALETGVIHPGHLWCLLEHVAPIADDAVRTRVQRELLDWLAVRHRVTTPAQLGDRVRRVVARHDARDAARDLARALRQRGVSVRPERTAGMSAVTVICSTPEAQAFVRALSAYVDALETDPADPRSRGQQTVDALLDLVLRPGEADLPPVQALLTLVASVPTMLGGDGPGEVDGQVVPAEMARQLARAFTGLPPTDPDPSTEPDIQKGSGGLPPQWSAGGEPVDTEGGPVDRAAAELSAEDFDRWLDDLVRQAFGEDPVMPPDPDDHPGAMVEGSGTAPPPLTGGSAPQPDDVASRPGGEWWAAADRAVEDASEALLVLDRALSSARRMVGTAERADAADEAVWATSPAGRVSAAGDALTALTVAADRDRASLADLLGRTAGGGLADRPRIALTDAVTGALIALTDLPALRRTGTCGRPACRRRPEHCDHDLTGRPGLGPPADSPGYRPEAALDRFTRARDRRCRFPGCRRRVPAHGDLDHVHRWPDGPTSAANLAGLCTTDHRGKHQAPGWTHRLGPDATLTVTTPSGLTAVTEPPPY
ncbi:HNH endonuclease signature motif containing protein [Geodermatophilus amargosae]|uniref:HNH endonuclease signature motif containing protein n=1 Tax=Geodermatophilus amargosae TaxID=1296565 RepID=UPI001FEC1000|nr:HNH endonuclease signature motif containing protein [Geodermatophilus amargosae]